ncbi:MAG: nucleotidyltransferase family protein [Rikenellaceae bacterium]
MTHNKGQVDALVRVREQLLELLRSTLWGTEPSIELFEGSIDLGAIVAESKKQSVLSSIYVQLDKLPQKLPKTTILSLHTLTTRNRTMQLKQLQVIDKVTKRLQAGGIERPVLLKGAGVMMNYLDPGVRQCGDIDLYVGKEQYEEACKIAASWDECITDKKSKSLKHFHIHFEGISVEIHRKVISSTNISRNASAFERWCVESLEGDDLRRVNIGGVEIYLPPYNFDAIYIFYHAWDHFCTYGISFRQISDWCRFLSVYRDQIDREKLAADLKRFGLVRPWGYFAGVATTCLGLDQSALVSFDSSKDWRTERVCEKIWRCGNFGHFDDRNATGKGYNIFVRKLVNFFSLFNSFAFLFSIDRRYSMNYLFRTPLKHLKTNIAEAYYTLTHK